MAMMNLTSVLSYYIPKVLPLPNIERHQILHPVLLFSDHTKLNGKNRFGDDTELDPSKRTSVKDFPVKFLVSCSRMSTFMQKEKYVPLYLAFFLT